MSTRKCDRCDENCYGCDNDDDPHYCPSCKEKKDMSKLDGIKHILDAAQKEAERFCHEYIGTEHLILALAPMCNLVVLGIKAETVRIAVEKIVQTGYSMSRSGVAGRMPFTPRSKLAIGLAADEATSLGSDIVLPNHLLVGLIREEEGVAAVVLQELGVTVEKARTGRSRVKQFQEARGELSPVSPDSVGSDKSGKPNITETISTEAPKPGEHIPKPGEIFYAREWLRHPLGEFHESAALCAPGEDGIGYSYIYLGDPPPRYNTTGGMYSVPMPEADQEIWRKKRQDICYVSTVNMVA